MTTLPRVLPLSHATLSWLREGGLPTRIDWRQRLLYRWQSHWFDYNLKLQRRLGPCRMPDDDPVFVLGLWRSGTTFLHELLAACPGMTYPATWQCMQSATMRLRRPSNTTRAVRRPMDAVLVDALSPQEDEFALLAMGVPSVYRGFLDPRRLRDLARWLQPQQWRLDDPNMWLETWREFLSSVAADRPGRLLLKSPTHSFRIRALIAAFPNAKYLWITRNPGDCFQSNRRMWSAMFQQYALWNWDARELDEFLDIAFRCAAQCLSEACEALPPNRFAVVDFQNLIARPVDTVEAANIRLDLGQWQQMEPALRFAATAKKEYPESSHDHRSLPEHVTGAIAVLSQAQQRALTTHGL